VALSFDAVAWAGGGGSKGEEINHHHETAHDAFRAEVESRFGIVPNFFRSARAAPELIEQLWGFAKAGYLDNPMPSVFKERLFVWLSRFCPMRYCIVRHVGFLLGGDSGHASGDASAVPQTVGQIVRLLRRPTPWQRDMSEVYDRLEALPSAIAAWPESDEPLEDALFACAAVMFLEPARSERARSAVARAVGTRSFEFFGGCLAFIRTAHYWTMLHPEIETEEDMQLLMREHDELARLLLEDSEAERSHMGEGLFEELTTLRELHERRDLERAKRALEEKDRQKDQFIAVLAHELRNPLAAIRAATDAMDLIDLSDPRALRLVERLDRQTRAMTRMLEDLLDASRIALGKVSVRLQPVDMVHILTDVLDEQSSRILGAGLKVVTKFPATPCIAQADRVRLRQIVDNLLSNAVKFTPADGTIELSCVREGSEAVVTIRDSGIGFEAEFAGRMFEPFTQREQERDRPSGGLGLGLAIASQLAKLQGGSLSAESAGTDRGSLFTLRIPLSDAADDGSRPASPAARGGRRTVLVVEDNADVAAGLAQLLELMGVEVSVAHEGTSAVRMALALVPDVILCDLGLPGEIDGFGVARACRAEPSLRSVRLVAASGYSSAQDHADSREAGFDCLLTKPVSLESLTLVTRAPGD
jgi:signal transduction histidine kinase